MNDKCTRCDGTGLITVEGLYAGNEEIKAMTNCPDCHGLGRCGE